MTLVMTAPPALEPVTLAEAKAHLRVDGTAEDTLVQSLILTSRLHIEAALGLALITQGWSWYLDDWPPGRDLALPMRPVASISAVRVYAADDTPATIASTDYLLDGAGAPPRLVRKGAAPWPRPGRAANGVEIAFTAGYGALASNVPAPIRQALLLLVAHWYEHRDPIEVGSPAARIPSSVSDLLMPYRQVRL